MALPRPNLIYQFKITLEDISPAIWRRILVPDRYTFWDLHVAIQDSMGWLDYHLHAFELKAPGSRNESKLASRTTSLIVPLPLVGRRP